MTDDARSPLLRPEPGYLHILRLGAAAMWIPLLLGILIADRVLLRDTPFGWLGPVVVAVFAAVAIVIGPQRMYRRLGYRIEERMLQAVRGWIVHVDTLVPFVRIQHIDVTRSLLDKMFGTATLIVHTAGTHNSIVTIPGLAPPQAAEIRDRIREHIRTDFE